MGTGCVWNVRTPTERNRDSSIILNPSTSLVLVMFVGSVKKFAPPKMLYAYIDQDITRTQSISRLSYAKIMEVLSLRNILRAMQQCHYCRY